MTTPTATTATATTKINFTALLEPVPFKRHMKSGRNPPEYSDFKAALGFIAKAHMQGRAPLKGAISFRAEFYKSKPKSTVSRNWGDLDNHVKAVLDALNGICFDDDRQIVQLSAQKFFGEPKIVITLEEI